MKNLLFIVAALIAIGLALFNPDPAAFALLGVAFGIGMVDGRTLRDENAEVITALPAANASNQSAVLDTAFLNPGRIEEVELRISLPATPALADGTSITLTVQDSADGSSFANVADLPAVSVTGAGGAGSAGTARQFKLPVGTRRYLRLNQAVANGAGNNTAVSTTFGFVF